MCPRTQILGAQGSNFWDHLSGMKLGLLCIRWQAVGVNKALGLGLSLGRVLVTALYLLLPEVGIKCTTWLKSGHLTRCSEVSSNSVVDG